jgi:hypothetical protein
MKKLLVAIILVGLVFSLPLFAMGEDSKEVLILKRENVILKMQNMEMQLTMNPQYQALIKEAKEIDAQLKALETKKEEKPKIEEKKK